MGKSNIKCYTLVDVFRDTLFRFFDNNIKMKQKEFSNFEKFLFWTAILSTIYFCVIWGGRALAYAVLK